MTDAQLIGFLTSKVGRDAANLTMEQVVKNRMKDVFLQMGQIEHDFDEIITRRGFTLILVHTLFGWPAGYGSHTCYSKAGFTERFDSECRVERSHKL